MRFDFSLSKKTVLIVMLVIASVMSLLGPGASDYLRMPAVWALAPVSDFVKSSTSAFKSAMADREEPAISASEAVRLRKEVEYWRAKAHRYNRERKHWWDKSRRIQNTRNAFGPSAKRYEFISARVIMNEPLPYGQSQTISSGTIHGLERGMRVVDILTDRSKALPTDEPMPVISGASTYKGKPIVGCVLIGWVEATGSFTARVRLVTDKRFKIKALLYRTIDPSNPRTITSMTPDGPVEEPLTSRNNKSIEVTLSGDGKRGLVTSAVAKDYNIRTGDWLWTADISRKLPDRLRIGKVVSVKDAKNPNFVIVHVAPAARLGALRDVFIVRSLVSPRGGQ
ncbi:MAG: rod shape-determining protein MreC [bacterium]|nr:rod shape-determining protein MreC [bacterium]